MVQLLHLHFSPKCSDHNSPPQLLPAPAWWGLCVSDPTDALQVAGNLLLHLSQTALKTHEHSRTRTRQLTKLHKQRDYSYVIYWLFNYYMIITLRKSWQKISDIVISSINSFSVLNCPNCPDQISVKKILQISIKICHCSHNNKYIVKQKFLHIKLIKALFSRLSRNYTEYTFSLRNSERHFLVKCHQSCFFFTTLSIAMTRT